MLFIAIQSQDISAAHTAGRACWAESAEPSVLGVTRIRFARKCRRTACLRFDRHMRKGAISTRGIGWHVPATTAGPLERRGASWHAVSTAQQGPGSDGDTLELGMRAAHASRTASRAEVLMTTRRLIIASACMRAPVVCYATWQSRMALMLAVPGAAAWTPAVRVQSCAQQRHAAAGTSKDSGHVQTSRRADHFAPASSRACRVCLRRHKYEEGVFVLVEMFITTGRKVTRSTWHGSPHRSPAPRQMGMGIERSWQPDTTGDVPSARSTSHAPRAATSSAERWRDGTAPAVLADGAGRLADADARLAGLRHQRGQNPSGRRHVNAVSVC